MLLSILSKSHKSMVHGFYLKCRSPVVYEVTQSFRVISTSMVVPVSTRPLLGHQNCCLELDNWTCGRNQSACHAANSCVVKWCEDSCKSRKSICSFVRNNLRRPDVLGAMSPDPLPPPTPSQTLLCNVCNLIASNLVAVSGMSQAVAPGIFASNDSRLSVRLTMSGVWCL